MTTRETMSEKSRVCAVQCDVAFGDVAANLGRVTSWLQAAAKGGARLAVFPECVLTGYGFHGTEEAAPVAADAAAALPALEEACRDLRLTAVVGTLLPAEEGVFNAAWVVTPVGTHVYRKCHLPFLGIDKSAVRGASLDVFETPAGRVGVIICYDLRFPEAARTLALRGADIIAVPTNWPQGAESAPEYLVKARAFENRVTVVAANRIGDERGFTFIGRTQIAGPDGRRLGEAGGTGEVMLFADADLSAARDKRVVIRPGEFEMDLFADRRPDIYETGYQAPGGSP